MDRLAVIEEFAKLAAREKVDIRDRFQTTRYILGFPTKKKDLVLRHVTTDPKADPWFKGKLTAGLAKKIKSRNIQQITERGKVPARQHDLVISQERAANHPELKGFLRGIGRRTASNPLDKQAGYMSQERRESLPSKAFAVPESKAKKIGVGGEIQGEAKGKYPIPDEKHARNALARVSQHGTPAEREAVRKKVYAKYPQLKEGFEERHGESPTSKENVKKVEQGGIGKGGCMGTKLAMITAFYDEMEKIGAAYDLSPEELEKLAGVLERMGLGLQRGVRKAGAGLKRGYEKAQLTAGDIMTGHHGHGIEHALQKMPTASPTKMGLAYVMDPHVQKAVGGHVARGAQAVGRGARDVGRTIREAVTPGPSLRPAYVG